MAEVTLPRWVFFSLVAGLAVSSLAAVFLAGRLSAPVATARPVGVPSPPPARADGASPPQRGSTVDAAPGVPPPAGAALQTPSAVSPAARPPSPSSGCPDPEAIQRYLTAMETAVATGKTWDDPTQLAQTIVTDAIAGRTAGLDGLLSSNTVVLDRVSSIVPPPDCRDCVRHHAETHGTLQASLRLLGSMRDGIASGELGALLGAQAEAGALETRAREVEALDETIRRRCSL